MKTIERFNLDLNSDFNLDLNSELNSDLYFDTMLETDTIDMSNETINSWNDYTSSHLEKKKRTPINQNSLYSEEDIDRLLKETDDDDKIDSKKIEYIDKSIAIINRTMLDIAKKDKEIEELNKKREEFERSIQKSQLSLGKKYVNNNIKINDNSGSINNKKKIYIFGESLHEKGELFSIKLPKMTDYVYLNINVKINGKFNKENTMLLGITDKKHYWAIERGPKNTLNWHYDIYNNKKTKKSKKTVNEFGSVYDDIVFNIDFNKQLKEIKMYAINGNNEVDWTPENSILPSGDDLYLIVHRGSIKDQYTINNIQIDINKSFAGKNKNPFINDVIKDTSTQDGSNKGSDPPITEPPEIIPTEGVIDEVCQNNLQYYTNTVYFLVFALFCVILYLMLT